MQAWNEIPEAKLDTPKGIGWVFVLIRIILIVLYVLSLFVIHIFLSFFGWRKIGNVPHYDASKVPYSI